MEGRASAAVQRRECGSPAAGAARQRAQHDDLVRRAVDCALSGAVTWLLGGAFIIIIRRPPGGALSRIHGFRCAQLKSDLLANPAQALTIAKNLGVVKNNIKAATQIPKRATKVTKNLNKDLRVMVSSFGGKWPPI